MNWKTTLGVILIFGAARELMSVIVDYRSGKLQSWPLGIEIGCAAVVALGTYLIWKGQKQRKSL
ncbi:hypothetical protein [Terrimonas ferruginea]|uniref:hypothetical protein n=1 Tax=Terrimonas ferruginea TaxID=249 RepID=UPI00048C7218|nr:hypothetical protein [Terrimonas ferruginea]